MRQNRPLPSNLIMLGNNKFAKVLLLTLVNNNKYKLLFLRDALLHGMKISIKAKSQEKQQECFC